MINSCRLLLAAAIPAMLAGSALAAEDPRDWLQRMSNSVEYLNYEGTLVHLFQGEAVTLSIVHRVEDGVVSERLSSLDGAGREIIRNGEEVKCIFPDEDTVLVETREDRNRGQSPLRATLPLYSDEIEAHYRFDFRASDRIAGRSARVVAVRPMDSYRYGYQIWLDSKTAIPLKSQLKNEQGQVVEQIMFTDIKLPESIPEERVQPSVEVFGMTLLQAGPGASTPARSEKLQGPVRSSWAAARLPPGFEMSSAHDEVMVGSENPTRHLVYSDGLASVSVFIDEAVAAAEEVEGSASISGANAYTLIRGGYLITALGVVPPHTVEMIAGSVVPVAGDD